MHMILLAAFLCLCIHEPVGCEASAEKDDKALLQDLLIQSKEQNRKLEQQMNRMKLMWSGLQQMCSVLESYPCDCKEKEQPILPGGDENNGAKEKEQPLIPGGNENNGTKEVDDNDVRARLLSVASRGLQEDGSVDLTFVYSADKGHAVHMLVPYYSDQYGVDDLYRPVGETLKLDEYVYTKRIHVPNYLEVRAIYLRVYSGKVGITATIDLQNAHNETIQYIAEYKSAVVELNNTYVAPRDDSLNVSLVVKEDARDSFLLEHSTVALNGLNTQKSPPQLFEITTYTKDSLKLSGGMKTDTTSWLNITVSQEYAQFGGLLTIELPIGQYAADYQTGDLIEKLYEIRPVDILAPGASEVVPKNIVGLYPQETEMDVYQEKSTLACFAMGNPLPVVSLYKHSSGDRKRKLKVDTVSIASFMHMASYTLDKNDLRSPKTFTCRAVSGSAVAEQTITARMFMPIHFDMAKTGLMKNSTEKMVFGCKASWKTSVELAFHLYDEFGPVLDDKAGFTVVSKRIGKKTNKLTLTISPRDDAIHTVLCVATTPEMTHRQHKMIEVFPGLAREWDWDLYANLGGDNSTTAYYDDEHGLISYYNATAGHY